MSDRPGALIAIGGHEDRDGARRILRIVAERTGGRPIGLITAASVRPERYVELYRRAFEGLDTEVVPLDEYDTSDEWLAELGGVFLTGGSQRRLVGRLRDRDMLGRLQEFHRIGGLVAGTSAGATALADRMIVRGAARRSPGGTQVELQDGLGLIAAVLIDQHFAQRGRSGRLRAAVALEPSRLGIGIDEDTAAVFEGDAMQAYGSGAVTVLDARTAIAVPGSDHRAAALRGATLHVLADGDRLDLG